MPSPRIKFEPVTLERVPEAGVCATLAPGVAAKYFMSGKTNGSFETKTAKAICSRCPLQAECLDRAIKGPQVRKGDPGVRGGMAASEIARIQAWESYDSGLGKKPKFKRHERYRAPIPQKLPEERLTPRRIADLSFEERVYLIFRDAKAGKYPNLNAAIADISALHDAAVLRDDGALGMGARIVSTAGTYRDGRRNPRPVSKPNEE